MDKNFELVICIDREAKTKEILRTGTIHEIDMFTINFEDGKEIKQLYTNKVKQFYEKNKRHIEIVTRKTGKEETGDITVIGTINKETSRIKVLYKKQIKVFKKIIKFEKFVQYLRNNYYKEYCQLQMFNHLIELIFEDEDLENSNYKEEIELPEEIKEEISFLVRRVYYLYKIFSKEKNEISPDRIYTEIKKRQKNKEDQQDLELLEAYEIIDIEERRYYQKYDLIGLTEKKEKQKIKKISGGK